MDVVKIATPKSANKAQEALTYFAALYQIENEAKEQQCSFEERRLLRQTKALPILDKFYRWLVDIKNQVPPESAIGKAVNYTVTQWPFLKAYVDYGEVAIDTNWVENQNRPFALGRRNWLFVSHEKSAQIAALYYSLIQSAKLNELNPRTYIHYLLTQVHALRKNEVNARDLLPHRIDKKLLEQFAEQEIMKAKIIYS